MRQWRSIPPNLMKGSNLVCIEDRVVRLKDDTYLIVTWNTYMYKIKVPNKYSAGPVIRPSANKTDSVIRPINFLL